MVMANEFAGAGAPTVHIDNLTAAFNAANYLHELGHQRIGCTQALKICPFAIIARRAEWVQGRCAAAVSPSDPHYIARGNFTFEAGAMC